MVWLQMVTIEAPVVEHNSDKFLRAIEAAGSDPAGVATSDASIDIGGVLTSFSLATYGNGWAP